MYNYLFGTQATSRKPFSTSEKDWLILGAYPSALHVRWEPLGGRGISAVAIADEPEPFWEGHDQEDRIKHWLESLPWVKAWGRVSSPGRLNGSSGAWLAREVLSPLQLSRDQVWITDCLDMYHESKGAADRLNALNTQGLLAKLSIKDRNLPSHPSEARIVKEAQLDRLRMELAQCHPKHVVTLGNAALRVFGNLIEGALPIQKLTPDTSYGRRSQVRIKGGPYVELLPLAHPGAPAIYQSAHANWRASQKGNA